MRFLTNPQVFCRPFADFAETLDADDIVMYSDASRNFQKGFGAWCESSWMWGAWDPLFMQKVQPSIEYLELFAVTAAVVTWIH